MSDWAIADADNIGRGYYDGVLGEMPSARPTGNYSTVTTAPRAAPPKEKPVFTSSEITSKQYVSQKIDPKAGIGTVLLGFGVCVGMVYLMFRSQR